MKKKIGLRASMFLFYKFAVVSSFTIQAPIFELYLIYINVRHFSGLTG